ncbi:MULTISPECIES: hypothetical protein [unclassified Mesorhizobium]|uniref:hypothetical protein n=1 Tax=unclassified Mesorhizobium TaxID=325217 RepID=UPI000FCA5AF9|nr:MULTISPECIES: hypothetical protein [unclassified Mesorhizobium]RUX94544.1 hypothetical protein EN993_15105 [Mesorhizobium sp. M7D.F.Ca.US.004.01.2.1]RVA24900.1 hypothetical protein EN935_25305 [Mesorhizobium sp. M7D.F.Ca.US.004.03.1.1]
MELYATISLNTGRLSAIAEQLCQHASGDVETDVQACRADSMEVMRDITRLVALIALAGTTPPRKPH